MGLKFMLQRIRNAVLFQVLEQDGFINEVSGEMLRFDEGPLLVASVVYPEISSTEVILRGCDKEQDSKVAAYSFESPELAEEYVKDVEISLLKLFSEHPDFEEKGVDYEYLVRRVVSTWSGGRVCDTCPFTKDCPSDFLESCAKRLLDWLTAKAQNGKRVAHLVKVASDTYEIKWGDRPGEEEEHESQNEQ